MQRHLLFPSLADLQVECDQPLQYADELQIGSRGGFQTISTSSVEISELKFLGIVKSNGNEWLSRRFPLSLTWIKKVRVSGSILATRYVPLGAMKLTWPEVVLQLKLK